jgi:hypothetical protein
MYCHQEYLNYVPKFNSMSNFIDKIKINIMLKLSK